MRYRTVSQERPRTIVAVFDQGDEVLTGLTHVAEQEALSAASVTAIGAVEAATLGWFDLDQRRYRELPVEEQAEVLSLVGDVARGEDDRPTVHVHAVLGLRDGSTRGGHLLRATVRPTLEAVLTESPDQLRKTYRPELGLALIDLDQ